MSDYFIAGNRISPRPLPPGLYVVATPIGNLGDITLRALETLAAADCIACEDTRISGRLLQRYGIRGRLVVYHEHNADRAGAELIDRLGAGEAVALICDAGTPLISDPGYRLVRDARAAGHEVWPVPGPSAPVAALSASGLPSNGFRFEGFLPQKTAARRNRLAALKGSDVTLVFYESPNRLAASLADIVTELGTERQLCVFREITKRHEEAVTATAAELAARFAQEKVKGEIVILVAPGEEPLEMNADAVLSELLARMSVSAAASEAAAMTGLPKRELYQRALQLSGKRKNG